MEYNIGTKVFGDWEIVRELGEGSYGKVFELRKTSFGVTAKSALKLIRIPKSVSEIREALSEGMDEKTVTSYFENIVEHFVREIAVMSELKSHPNIVACEDYVVEPHAGTVGWDILIRMELLTSLQDYQLSHTMDEAAVRRLAVDICEALVFCQRKGLIHRDIKPGNIFVDSMGRFKLGDFGVARTADKTMGGMSKQGTENYMAPEVYYGRPYGARVDIYSVGLMLYRLMNKNRLPFYPPAPELIKLSDRENALKKRMDGKAMEPPCGASPEFSAIILKACAHDPEDRYRTAAEMLEALTGRKNQEIPPEMVEDDSWDVFHVGADDDGGTVNMFGGGSRGTGADSRFGDQADVDGGTVNIFGGGKGGSSNQAGGGSYDSGDETIGPFGRRGKTGWKVVTPEQDNSEIVKSYWKEHLTGIWSKYANKKWGVYYAPDIPLQIYSNALYNIADNEIKKSDVLAILDCTTDIRVPCGSGIIVTKDKLFIQMGAEGGSSAGVLPKGVIEYTQVKRMWIGEKKKLFAKVPILCWETKDGKNHSYMCYAYSYVSYQKIIDCVTELSEKLS